MLRFQLGRRQLWAHQPPGPFLSSLLQKSVGHAYHAQSIADKRKEQRNKVRKFRREQKQKLKRDRDSFGVLSWQAYGVRSQACASQSTAARPSRFSCKKAWHFHEQGHVERPMDTEAQKSHGPESSQRSGHRHVAWEHFQQSFNAGMHSSRATSQSSEFHDIALEAPSVANLERSLRVLNLTPSILAYLQPSTLRAAYHKSALLWHPDRQPPGPSELEGNVRKAKFCEIQEAYSFLKGYLNIERGSSWSARRPP
ncbi:hypothetical protein WJX73_007492 [Symbiochloris irregularis]|uniref:J domain-containing protein n=1 Tax=Symbiochloris irregularis TaxID=706552 RepID=A0AAW1PLF7_9CHLO